MAVPVLFVKKLESSLPFFVDYRGINAFTIKNKYPLPLIRETLDRLCNAVYFTKLDIVTVFNKICMAAGEKWKITLRTRLGLYKYLVMLFELANAFSSFQNFINDVLENNILDLLIITYVDDILVFSKTFHKHKKYIKTVLTCYQVASL